MKLIVGLGNPGPKYETTRHNVGFLALDRMIERWNAQGPTTKFQAEVYQASVRGETVYLLKPQTYMNRSGMAVGPMFSFYKLKPDDLVVIHDDLDLPPISMRIKTGGGTGGHNGLKSIDEHLGSGQNGYHRIRMGIGHPLLPTGAKAPAVDYVLQPYTDDELSRLDPFLDRVAEAAELIIAGDVKTAMNRFNSSSRGDQTNGS